MKETVRKEKKTLADVKPMSPADLAKGIAELPPIIHNAIKDRLDEIPVYIQEALVQKIQLPRRAMIDYQIPFNRHQMRELALEAIYQHILLDKDIRKCLFDVLMESNQVDGYLYSLTIGTVENEEKYKEMLSDKLRSDWEFDRLSLLEQSILLISCQDLFVNQIPKPVVIDEAVTLAKEFCDETSPKLINGILDNLDDAAD
ncbi:MAG: transcription antitermination factor NusB [Allobaculum sp.]